MEDQNKGKRRPAGAPAKDQPAAAAPAAPEGGSVLASAPVGAPAEGGIAPEATRTLALDANVTSEFATIAPSFGDVLMSVGTAVAASQEALDKSVVEMARELSATKIRVVTDVIEKLNDDGLPDVSQTQLVSHQLSLVNYVSPTVHEWKHVAVSMDLTVGEVDSQYGFTFKQKQRSINAGGSLSWNFSGWFRGGYSQSSTETNYESSYESDWASGQVRVDALMAPRRTGKLPVGATFTVGPQIYIAQGTVNQQRNGQDVVTQRSVDLTVEVRKADGALLSGKPLVVESDLFGISFSSASPFNGSTTNTDGKVKVTITRLIPSDKFQNFVRGRVTVRLGSIEKTIGIVL